MNIQKVKSESLGPKQGGRGERTREGAERKANYYGREGGRELASLICLTAVYMYTTQQENPKCYLSTHDE